MATDKHSRAHTANQMLEAIASCGRRFFSYSGGTSRFEVDDRGRIWFIDGYKGRRIYTHYKYQWRGFTQGGTLRALVERLRDFIQNGSQLPAGIFGPWPEWVCGGDLWAYGEDMSKVREAAQRLGVTAVPEPGQCAEMIACGVDDEDPTQTVRHDETCPAYEPEINATASPVGAHLP